VLAKDDEMISHNFVFKILESPDFGHFLESPAGVNISQLKIFISLFSRDELGRT